MLPGTGRRLLLPAMGSLLAAAALLAPGSALAAAPGHGPTSRAVEPRIATGRTITVHGIRLAVPRPGTGVGASVLGRDGRSTLISVQTDAAGTVHVTTDAAVASPDASAAPSGVAGPGLVTTAALAACRDRKFTRTGSSWSSRFRWEFRSGSTPTDLNTDAVEQTLRRAVSNITHERNDCNRSDHVTASASYAGRTTHGTHIGSDASCRHADGVNVVAFATLPPSTLGFTCWWLIGSRTVEADTVFNKTTFDFALSIDTCSGAYMLEGVATHEFGHVFGLGHVNQTKHANLTMSPQIYACDNSDATLGLGDMLGLEALY